MDLKDIFIYGSGGFAREIALLIERINQKEPSWNILGFLDDDAANHGKIINGYTVVGGSNLLEENRLINVVLGIGSPGAKENIIANLKQYNHVTFPNIIHPDVQIHPTTTLGQGNIICEGNILTCNIELKDFVTVNLTCTIGHDVLINSYSTVLPHSSISGEVTFEKGVDFGTNATIIQGKVVGENTIVGAGATVVKDLPANCTAVGSPAKPIKYRNEN